MDEEDELVSGEEQEDCVEDAKHAHTSPNEPCGDSEVAESGEDDGDDENPDFRDEASRNAEKAGQIQEEGGEDDDEDPELDSNCSVPYNRQFYAVPNEAKVRDYEHPYEVASVERLSEMSQPNPPPEKWPAAEALEPSMIVVLKARVASNDSSQKFHWYIRIKVAGETDGDDVDIFRHIPKGVVKKLISHFNADPSMRTSSLLTKYVPYDDNTKPLNPSKLHENNWNVRKPAPKTLAQTIGKENKPGGAATSGGSSTVKRAADTTSTDAPLAEPVVKKTKPNATTTPKPKPATASKTNALSQLGKGPIKSSTSSTTAPMQKKSGSEPCTTSVTSSSAPAPVASKPKAQAPATAKPKGATSKPKSAVSRASPVEMEVQEENPNKKMYDIALLHSDECTVVGPGAESAGPPLSELMARDGWPAPGHKMTKTLVVSNDEHNPDEHVYTVTFPPWCKSWKITAEFAGAA